MLQACLCLLYLIVFGEVIVVIVGVVVVNVGATVSVVIVHHDCLHYGGI